MRRTAIIVAFALATAPAWAQKQAKKTTAKPASKGSTEDVAGSTASTAALPSRETVNNFMRRTFGWDKGFEWRVLDIRPSEIAGIAEVLLGFKDNPRPVRLLVMPGGQFAVSGEVIPFGDDPFAPVREKLAKRVSGPVKGDAKAPVTIVEFSDLQCPVCRDAQPILDKLVAESPNAKLVFQNFPLTQIHPWASQAAATGVCVFEQAGNDAFWKFAAGVYEVQNSITKDNAAQRLGEIAANAGADSGKVAACAANPATEQKVTAHQALGLELGVSGTPTVFINGRRVTGVLNLPYESLKAMVDQEAEESAKR